MIVYKTGDILETEEPVIAHGCNCSGGFSSGIAGQIAKVFPDARQQYLSKYKKRGWQLGDVQVVEVEPGRVIVNCGTQQGYGQPDTGPYVSYSAIRQVFQYLTEMFPRGYAVPKIGAGLAGGNWDIISKIIEEESGETEVRVYSLK